MIVIDFRKEPLPKTCHLRPGDCVKLYTATGELETGTYLVCSAGELNKKLGSCGLYKADVPVFLVSLETGIARPLPHLSSRLAEKVTVEAYLRKESE